MEHILPWFRVEFGADGNVKKAYEVEPRLQGHEGVTVHYVQATKRSEAIEKAKRERSAALARARKRKRKRLGLCGCGMEPTKGFSTCFKCRERHNKSQKARRRIAEVAKSDPEKAERLRHGRRLEANRQRGIGTKARHMRIRLDTLMEAKTVFGKKGATGFYEWIYDEIAKLENHMELELVDAAE